MNIRTNHWMRAAVLAPLAAGLALAACGGVEEDLLMVQTPDIVTVERAQSVAGAQSFFVAGQGDFARYIGGDRAGSSPLGLNLTSGLLADELISTRTGTEPTDNRSLNPNAFPIDSWTQVGNTYTRLVRANRLLLAFPPATGANDQLALLHAMEGMTLTILAETYCNGVPLWDGESDTDPHTRTFSTAELYAAAISQYDSAIAYATSTTSATSKNFALIGKARTILDQATPATLAQNSAAAAALVASVPSTFVYSVSFGKTTAGLVNAVYDWANATKNFGVMDREGGNGLDYVSAADPRVKINASIVTAGQDGTKTPQLNQYTSTDAAVPVATGVEARLILAESQIVANNPAYLVTLNALRASVSGLAPLTDPGTYDGRVNQLFRERAFWMYLTAHRLGDMRRLIRQYGRNSETVFPTGPYFKGGAYGTDVTLIPSQTETNNPNWTACTDRAA